MSPPHSGGGREGAVLSAYQQNDLIAQFVGQFDAAKGEAAAPRGHFVGLHRVEDVGELFDFVVGIAVGGAILEAVEFLVVEIFDGFHSGLHRAKLFAFRRFGRARGAVALAHDNGFFGAVGATIFAENKGENAQRQQRNQGNNYKIHNLKFTIHNSLLTTHYKLCATEAIPEVRIRLRDDQRIFDGNRRIFQCQRRK